jgi:hypothetical protein
MTDDTEKRLGTASYKASRMPDSNLVTLTAAGILPCANWQASLVQRPERIFPPMWEMVFWTTPTCLFATLPFVVHAHVAIAPGGADRLTVIDASGRVEVPIDDMSSRSTFGEIQLDLYCVHARLPKTKPAHGCIVVPYGSILPAVYYRAFGPAPKLACEQWQADMCGGAAPHLDGTPWPPAEGQLTE